MPERQTAELPFPVRRPSLMQNHLGWFSGLALFCLAIGIRSSGGVDRVQPERAITISKNFEAASLGKIEKLGETQFRCFVEGQHDEQGRNRQANWYYFCLDNVKGRDLSITLTDFLGEYNNQPGACPM